MDTPIYEPDSEENEQAFAEVLADADEQDSPLAVLRKQMQVEAFPPVVLPVPAREGWALKVRTDMQLKELTAFGREAAKAAKQNKTISEIAFEQQLTIAATTLAILYHGQPVTDDEGEPATFESQEFRATVGVQSVPGAVRAFIGRDGDVAAMAVAVRKASGFAADATVEEDEDPTGGGS